MLRLSTDNHPYWCDGKAWIDLVMEPCLSTVRLSSDVANSTTTLANVTGLGLALAANSTYQIDGQVMFERAAATTGIRLSQTVPIGAAVLAQWNTPSVLTTPKPGPPRAPDAGPPSPAIDAANANALATVSLLVITGAVAGNLQIRFASEVAASKVVVKAGSNLVATKVA